MTTTELEQFTESVTHGHDIDIKSPASRQNITETPVIRRHPSNHLLKAATEFTSSTPMMVGDRLTRLKQEFNRCVNDLKEKRAEITALKEQIIAKNRQIEQLKTDENRALIESTMAKENAERLTHRLKVVESELTESKKRAPSSTTTGVTDEDPEAIDEQSKLITKLEEENANFRKNFDHLNETIKELEDERDRIEEKYRESCQDIAELQHKLTTLETTGLGCAQCETARFEALTAKQEYKQLKELYLKLHEENEDISRKLRRADVSATNKEIDGQRELICSLEHSLQLAESKYAELTKKMLRDKTEFDNRIQSLVANGKRTKITVGLKKGKFMIISKNSLSGTAANESIGQRNSTICKNCIDLASKVSKFDLENLQIQTTCSDYLKEMHELKKSLKLAEQRIEDLKAKLSMKAEHDQLIDDLKSKAKQFEEFMRNQSPTKCNALDVVLNNRTNRVRDQCVSTEDLLGIDEPRSNSSNSTIGSDRAMDKKIREEMARAMAVKVKAVENQFKQQLSNYEKHIDNLTAELNEMQQSLSDRDNDVINLKKCVLTERAEIKVILSQKDAEFDEQMRRQHMMLMATRGELDKANKRVEFLTKDLNDHAQQFDEERASWTKLLNEYKNQLDASAEQEKLLSAQIESLEATHKAAIQSLNDKYHVARKVSANYKKYSEDKEQHIERESERIKLAYKAACTKMEENMTAALREQEKKSSQRIAELQAELEAAKKKAK